MQPHLLTDEQYQGVDILTGGSLFCLHHLIFILLSPTWGHRLSCPLAYFLPRDFLKSPFMLARKRLVHKRKKKEGKGGEGAGRRSDSLSGCDFTFCYSLYHLHLSSAPLTYLKIKILNLKNNYLKKVVGKISIE